MTASVLVICNPRDTHGRSVMRELRRRGIGVALLDLASFGQGAIFNHAIATGPSSVRTEDGRLIDIDHVTSVWCRRPAAPTISPRIRDPRTRNFAAHEWLDAMDGMLHGRDASFVNPLDAQRSAVKPRQLAAARSAGLRTPDTLVSNDPEAVADFTSRHHGRVIYKALSSPRHMFAGTERWSEAARPALLRDLPLAPAIFQELVDGPADIRATVIGKHVLAAEITRSADRALVDSRLEIDAPCKPYQLTPTIEAKLHDMMARLGLVFGTVDLRITDTGDIVFFEVNPQGQFLHIEIQTGLPITATLADYLSQG